MIIKEHNKADRWKTIECPHSRSVKERRTGQVSCRLGVLECLHYFMELLRGQRHAGCASISAGWAKTRVRGKGRTVSGRKNHTLGKKKERRRDRGLRATRQE